MDAPFAERLRGLDLTLFDPIPSQTTVADRRALLAVLRFFHERGSYRYLEVGSHLGGSLQIPYRDAACHSIQSIDPRPVAQNDARLGGRYIYGGNSAARMRALLRRIDPTAETKLHCHNGDLASYAERSDATSAELIFIDAEHTPEAMLVDFERALKLQPGFEVVLMHDVEALIGHEHAIEALALAHGLLARLLSPSLLALGKARFFSALRDVEVRPLSALPDWQTPAVRAAPVEVVPGVVIATTLAAEPDALIAGLVERHPRWFDAGPLKPAPSMPPGALNPAVADRSVVPVFREVFSPFATAFWAARSRGLKMVFLLPSPEQVLNNLGRAPVFAHSDSWTSIRELLVPRLLKLVEEAQLAARRGPTWCVFGPVAAAHITKLDGALEEDRGSVIGSAAPIPDILTPPTLSPATTARLGPLPDHHWVALYEAFEFAYNMVALTATRSTVIR